MTTDDVTSFTVGIKQSSSVRDQDELRQWCAIQENGRIINILGSNEKTIPSLVQYGFVKSLPLLSDLYVLIQDTSPRLLAERNPRLALRRFHKTRQWASPSGFH